MIVRQLLNRLMLLALCQGVSLGFVPQVKKFNANSVLGAETLEEVLPVATSEVVQTVGVAGATGRTGRLVVEELLNRNVQVVAMVRSMDKAKEVGLDEELNNLSVVQCDLTSEKDIEGTIKGCDSIIWCATGFSDAKTGIIEKLKRLVGIALAPKQSIDSVGIPLIAKQMMDVTNKKKEYPQVVMLSSAGVTRPQWDEAKKEKFRGAADIPIVRLNPFGILDVKAESEQKLRDTGVNYCIVRPCGLNDQWPSGSRPLISQGDVAVGRINRKDVATILVDVLAAPEAVGKTFEVVGLAGYQPPKSIGPLLEGLQKDSENVSAEALDSTYRLMQQLLPGEKQDSAGLAMGQTYEQLDKGETGRLGERGQENAEEAAPKPTTTA